MATSGEEVLVGVNNENLVGLDEAGNVEDLAPRDDHEDVEMSNCEREVEEGNGTEEPDVDMNGGEATEQSENLLDNSYTAYKEAVEASDDGGGGKQEGEPGVQEHVKEAADGESQEDDEDVDEGEEGSMQKKTGEDVLKDATNTASEVTAEVFCFWST